MRRMQPINALNNGCGRAAGAGDCGGGAGRGDHDGRAGRTAGSRSGSKVAAALVGTFLGILLCYGVVGPLSASMSKTAEEHERLSACAAVLMLAFLKGSAPMIAIEMGRRAIPAHVRPSFDEMEKTCKNATGAPAAAAAAAA